MGFNVSTFRANLTGDGARPTLFEVQLNLPAALQNLNSGGAFSQKLIFSARATQIPDSNMGQLPVQYFGRNVNIAGNRTFSEWTITIYNDEDFVVRNVLEQWMGSLNSHVGNVRKSALLSPNDYVADGSVFQYSKIGGDESNHLAKYVFRNAWPMQLSPIDLDWGAMDTIEEYTVTLSIDDWTRENAADFPTL